MAVFLQLLGILFLLVLVLIFGAYLLWLRQLRRFVHLADALNGDEQMPMALPPRIKLQALEPGTSDAEFEPEATALIEQFLALGFASCGRYVLGELYGVRLEGLCDPARRLWGVVYQHAAAGVFCDVVARFEPTGLVTVTTAPHGAELEVPPGHEKVHLHDAAPSELVAAMAAQLAGRSPAAVSPAGFTAGFEAAWADEMDWRNLRGFATDDEIRRTMAPDGGPVDEAVVAELRRQYDRASAVALSDAARAEYLASTSFSGAEWQQLHGRLVVIHDRLPRAVLADTFAEWLELGEEAGPDEDDPRSVDRFLARWGGGANLSDSPRHWFASANAALAASERFHKLGEVTKPLPADIYAAAE